MKDIIFRKAEPSDIERIAEIYDAVHDTEEAGRQTTGWIRNVYPTKDTARTALALGDMFVEIYDGRIVAAARINQEQVDVYAKIQWQFKAPEKSVMVLHTLVVDPAYRGRGFGEAFVDFYEAYALAHACPFLRIDTNARNTAARVMYKKLHYREAGIVGCVFNGIPDVQLICLEKNLNF